VCGDHAASILWLACDEIMRPELACWSRQRLSHHWRLLWLAHLR
jgi:hypothetical protein